MNENYRDALTFYLKEEGLEILPDTGTPGILAKMPNVSISQYLLFFNEQVCEFLLPLLRELHRYRSYDEERRYENERY